MERLPRYSTELIEWLDANVGKPQFPQTQHQIALLDEKVIRQGCFMAGQRHLVDELVALMRETDDAETDSEEAADDDLGSVILGADGEEREGLASAYVAASLTYEDGGDSRPQPEPGADKE